MRRPSRPADGFETDGFEPENASERSASYGTVRVTLGVTCAVAPGQTLWCVGGAPALGGWDMRASAPMDRVGADRWQCVVGVPFGPLEYRYVLATEMPETGGTRMESELGNARSRVVVSDNGPQLFVEETAPAFASAAAAMGVPLDGDDISEVAMNDDVTVVEDFTDVSDDELARLVADLRAELGEE